VSFATARDQLPASRVQGEEQSAQIRAARAELNRLSGRLTALDRYAGADDPEAQRERSRLLDEQRERQAVLKAMLAEQKWHAALARSVLC
jgi:hypothetical protein